MINAGLSITIAKSVKPGAEKKHKSARDKEQTEALAEETRKLVEDTICTDSQTMTAVLVANRTTS